MLLILCLICVWIRHKIIPIVGKDMYVTLSSPLLWERDSDEGSFRLISNIGLEYEDGVVDAPFYFHCLDSINGYYQSYLHPHYSQFPKSSFIVYFTEDSSEMERTMTEAQKEAECLVLAVHDCLFKTVIFPNVLIKDRHNLSIIRENCTTMARFFFGNKIRKQELDLGWIKGNSEQSYQFVYFSKISRKYYLLSALPQEEQNWGLWYYPTVMLDERIKDDDLFYPCQEDNTGILYKSQFNKRKKFDCFVYFYRISPQNYVRVLSSKKITVFQNLEDYYEDTSRMNALIQSYFRSF